MQDITYVAILKDYGKDVTIPEPEGYDPKEFACACASPVCITPKEPDRVWSKDMMITYVLTNLPFSFSSSMLFVPQ